MKILVRNSFTRKQLMSSSTSIEGEHSDSVAPENSESYRISETFYKILQNLLHNSSFVQNVFSQFLVCGDIARRVDNIYHI